MEIAGRWEGQADLAGCPGLGFAYTSPTNRRLLCRWLLAQEVSAVCEECSGVCFPLLCGLRVLWNCWTVV